MRYFLALGLLLSANAAQATLPPPVLSWFLEGDTTSSSSAVDGTFAGGSATYVADGIAGQALSMNASTSVTVSSSALPTSGPGSISLWFRSSSAPGGDFLMGTIGNAGVDSNGDKRGLVRFEGGMYFWGGRADRGASTDFPSDGQWHMATWTWNDTSNNSGESVALYLDDQLVESGAPGGDFAQFSDASGVFQLGGSTFYTDGFIGDIDEVAVYAEQLSGSQVQERFDTTPTPTPVLYWPLDGNLSSGVNGGLSGTFNGGTAPFVSGASGDAVAMSASTSITAAGGALPTSGPGTITMWLRLDSAPSGNFLVGTLGEPGVDSNGDKRGLVRFEDGMYFWGGRSDGGSSTDFADDGLWHMVTWVWDDTSNDSGEFARLYLDDVEVRDGGLTGDFAALGTTDALFQVGGSTFYTDGVIGRVDEVRVYDEALSIDQIIDLFDAIPDPNAGGDDDDDDDDDDNDDDDGAGDDDDDVGDDDDTTDDPVVFCGCSQSNAHTTSLLALLLVLPLLRRRRVT